MQLDVMGAVGRVHSKTNVFLRKLEAGCVHSERSESELFPAGTLVAPES